MAVTLLVLSGAFYVGASGHLAWVAVASVAAYVGFFAIGLGPVFWLLIAEIFPLALRGRAMSLATVANWGFNLIVSATFLDLVGAVGSAGAFLIYAVLSLAALVFIVRDGAGDQGTQPRRDRGQRWTRPAIIGPGCAGREVRRRSRGCADRRGDAMVGRGPDDRPWLGATPPARHRRSGLRRATGRSAAG